MPQPQAARQPLLETPEEQYRVQYWKAYAKERNARLTDAEAEAIVRWVLYYSAYYGVDHRLIFAVMRYESDFDPGCVSHAGAIGLMQLMPETARDLGVDPWVVEENIRGGIAELAGYLDRYADRPNYEQTVLALACYNAGPNAVKRAGGVPPITETINYVQRVTDLFYRFVKSGAP
ncbi:MAG: lytic transglycosylase domain-containing protein [Armatimonadetes bacterium]|nr:lytic transglycosylase domain-containing protein [Armatimonadota bacterium]